MLCEKCKLNNATVKYSQNVNGKKVEHNLCNNCFNKLNYGDSFIDNFFNSFFTNNLFFNEYDDNYRCNVCGNTLENLKRTGKMGCANCYNVFRNKLDSIFNNMQEKNIHLGKSPKNLQTFKPNIETDEKENIEALKQKLNIAIQNEDYEQAIEIRDKIKSLERGDI